MWKKNLLLAFWLLLSLVLQATVVPSLGGFLRRLDLILALTATVALLYGPKEGAIFGLIAGLLRDVTLGLNLGLYSIPLFVVGYGIGHFSRIVFRDSIVVPFLVGLGSMGIYWLMLTAINGFLFGYWLSGGWFWQLATSLLANSLIVPVIYALIGRFRGRLDESSRGRLAQ